MHRSLRRRATGLLLAAGATVGTTLGVVGAQPASAALPKGFAFVANDQLLILTGPANDDVVLRLAPGEPNALQIDFDGDGRADARADRRRFDEVVALLGTGNDTFRVDQANGTFADELLRIHGQSGNDNLNGGDNVERFFGGNGNDFADGNRGADSGFLGNGDDVFRWDAGDGSDLVEGDAGVDTLDFRGAGGPEKMSLTANGARSKFFRDAGNITMDMGGVEQLDLLALGGADTVEIGDMTGTGFRLAEIDPGEGDAADDTIIVNGTARADAVDVSAQGKVVRVRGLQTAVDIATSETTDSLQVRTLAGNDTVNVADAAKALLAVVVDLGADEV